MRKNEIYKLKIGSLSHDHVTIFDIGLPYLNCSELERKFSVCTVHITREANGRRMPHIICSGEEKNVMPYLCLRGAPIWNHSVNSRRICPLLRSLDTGYK